MKSPTRSRGGGGGLAGFIGPFGSSTGFAIADVDVVGAIGRGVGLLRVVVGARSGFDIDAVPEVEGQVNTGFSVDTWAGDDSLKLTPTVGCAPDFACVEGVPSIDGKGTGAVVGTDGVGDTS